MFDHKLMTFFEKKLTLEHLSCRYWWFAHNPGQLPIFFNFFSESQKQLLCDWYDETDETGSGECNYPLIGMLIGLIGANPASKMKMVQLGHYNGFSSLMCGFIYKNLNLERSFFSIDISANITEQANKWVKLARLEDYVMQIVGDSADGENIIRALQYLDSDEINILLIDSSHEYEHTCKELNLWFPRLSKGGFIFLHDTSQKARQKNGLGVYDALQEFCVDHPNNLTCININGFVQAGTNKKDLLYQDGCGLGILQKM